MAYNVFIFHGTGGHPAENWFPWLKKELEEIGITVYVPHFPTPEGQSVAAWLKVLEPYRKYITRNSIFVGHSLGGVFLLHLLPLIPYKVKAAFFVGMPIGIRPILNYERDSAFGSFDFKWDEIRKKAGLFAVYHSDNDPYVGLENGRELAKRLDTQLTFIPNAGHFNKKSGYLEFDKLLEKLKELY